MLKHNLLVARIVGVQTVTSNEITSGTQQDTNLCSGLNKSFGRVPLDSKECTSPLIIDDMAPSSRTNRSIRSYHCRMCKQVSDAIPSLQDVQTGK